MSGGYFDHQQYHISDIIEKLERVVANNHIPDEVGFAYELSDKTIEEFKKGLGFLRLAEIYTRRIDWLLSADDGEETFHRRLKEDLELLT